MRQTSSLNRQHRVADTFRVQVHIVTMEFCRLMMTTISQLEKHSLDFTLTDGMCEGNGFYIVQQKVTVQFIEKTTLRHIS